MALPIIVVGAGGRMGRTICGLVEASEDLVLSGMVEKAAYQPKTAPDGCIVGEDLADVAPKCPGDAVVVDFSAPEASMHSAEVAAKEGLGLVIGTTGLDNAQKARLEELAGKTPIFWSPNMSIGVNVLKTKILPMITKMLGDDYDVDIMEIHHNRKKDAPSGTALHLAEAVACAKDWKLDEVRCSGRDGIIGARPKKEIGVQALRGGDVVGVHTVYYMGPGENIEITHRALSRDNFARGALRAARWIAGQNPGKLLTMADLL